MAATIRIRQLGAFINADTHKSVVVFDKSVKILESDIVVFCNHRIIISGIAIDNHRIANKDRIATGLQRVPLFLWQNLIFPGTAPALGIVPLRRRIQGSTIARGKYHRDKRQQNN